MPLNDALGRWLGLAASTFVLTVMSTLAGAATITVSPSASQVEVGGTFSVFFDISGLTSAADDSFAGFDLDVLSIRMLRASAGRVSLIRRVAVINWIGRKRARFHFSMGQWQPAASLMCLRSPVIPLRCLTPIKRIPFDS